VDNDAPLDLDCDGDLSDAAIDALSELLLLAAASDNTPEEPSP
jgi:hypothetical protein